MASRNADRNADIVRKRQRGAKLREIGAEYGVTRETVRKVLFKAQWEKSRAMQRSIELLVRTAYQKIRAGLDIQN